MYCLFVGGAQNIYEASKKINLCRRHTYNKFRIGTEIVQNQTTIPYNLYRTDLMRFAGLE